MEDFASPERGKGMNALERAKAMGWGKPVEGGLADHAKSEINEGTVNFHSEGGLVGQKAIEAESLLGNDNAEDLPLMRSGLKEK